MTITERIDAVTLVTEAWHKSTLPAPKAVKIELTGRCNYRCGFCALRTRKEQPRTDMEFSLFQRITKEMREAGVEEIGVFYLGESFMNIPLLVDAVAWLKKELGFPYVFLTSNASLATPDVVKQIMEAGLDSLKWSVNAADVVQFQSVMGVSERYYYKALENIKAAKEVRDINGFSCGLYASSIQYDGDQHAKMQLVVDDIKPYVDEHYWLPLYSMGSLATQREEELGYRPTAGNQGRIGALREPLPCWSAFTEGHVTASGGLSACCFDADSRWQMGDLYQDSFMGAWNSDAFVALREAHLKRDVTGTVCEECVAY
jgi:MoaA/NifB/PqqE/SkfB family radical SAM enzyme